MTQTNRPLVLALSGASGMIYAQRTLKFLLHSNLPVDLVCSKGAYRVWRDEMGVSLPLDPVDQADFWRTLIQEGGGKLTCHSPTNVGASIASGSYRTRGMLVIPCSMSKVANLAHGISMDLVERAADVHIKEGRRVVVVPRETPFSIIHLRNLLLLAEAGVRVVPANPGWYHQPKTVEALVDFVISRALDQLDLDNELFERWQGEGLQQQTSSTRTILS
ncbi:flavin prenyltransferase UbiX [Anthocerotibacter panamensis]|uniref:flavin prenyltransferase UbiX n=1 Tax=Anthocerotibacter panamensis TaxID=2857077 RepID=UPI001C405E55|nr:flavin prenyltransferase UbiX [Anthocerotibacter panamensis]